MYQNNIPIKIDNKFSINIYFNIQKDQYGLREENKGIGFPKVS